MDNTHIEVPDVFAAIRRAAQSPDRVAGLTHRHYKYPARFSPQFVAAVIESLSKPGDLVLDPYMGGGTTIVEAMVRNRRVVGCDLNSLAVFVTKAKTTVLTRRDAFELRRWASDVIPTLMYNDTSHDISKVMCEVRTRNLQMPRARAIKKFIALALLSHDQLSSERAMLFARCALLNVSQWALNGRKQKASLAEFRARLTSTAIAMVDAAEAYGSEVRKIKGGQRSPVLIHGSSEHLGKHRVFRSGDLVDLVITSPPYPGVHVLYHRWQVDGRKETPAPYWIANCLDGQGSSYYNFGSRFQENNEDYFDESLKTLRGIRSVMRDGGVLVQMIAFSDAESQLPRYLENMSMAGFAEMPVSNLCVDRIWRDVPGRSWHAQLQGDTSSAREIVLFHTAA